MITANATVDLRPINKAEAHIKESPALISNAMKILRRRALKRLRERTQDMPEQSPLPFIWSLDPKAQARARAYWFAVRVPRGSKGGRYKRRGKAGGLITKWEYLFELTRDEGSITLVNTGEGSEYVYGPRQVPSHTASGWINKDTLASEEGEWLRKEARELFYTVGHPFGGIQ